MSEPTIKSRTELVTDAIRRILTYTTEITYFGDNSVGAALAQMVAGLTSTTYRLYRALLRRYTLMAASDTDFLTDVAAEMGADRLGPQRARLLVVFEAQSSVVTAITIGVTDLIEVTDSTAFAIADSIRVRSETGADTEAAVIIAITTATGPNGGDELEVATLTNTYAPSSEDVRVLLRHTIVAGTVVSTSIGESFELLDAVTLGDSNPVMDGESSFLGLADKGFCEAVVAGVGGNVAPLVVNGLAVADPKVAAQFNPEAGFGGSPTETAYDLKYRASHGPGRHAQETAAWIDQLARDGEPDVLRTIVTPTAKVSTMAIRVLARNGGEVSVSKRSALQQYLQQRVRSHLTVEVESITLTSLEVSAQITIGPDAVLRDVWRAAADAIAAHVDYRKREFGAPVDEATLLSIVRLTVGVTSLVTSTFTPTTDVVVGSESLPTLTRLTIEDTATGDILGADLLVSF